MTKIRSTSLLTLLSIVGHTIQIVLLLVLLFQVRDLQHNLITSSQAVTRAALSTPAPSQLTIISEDIPIGDSPVKGPSNAPVTIIVFSDFECPYCQRAQRAVSQLLQQYKEQIRFVYHDFPLEGIHPHAFQAAIAARCAREQGKFWEMHGKLFENQYALATNDLLRYASEIGLDLERFRSCIQNFTN
jgi:protein-disulfide isomerase